MTKHSSTFFDFLYLPLTLMVSIVDVNQLMILGWMVILDFLTGTAKSYVLKIDITRKRMIDGAITKTTLFIIPLVLALLAKGVGLDAKDYLFWIISILIVAEGYGIVGNIISIKDKKQIEEKDIINIILHNLRNMMLRYLTKDKDIK